MFGEILVSKGSLTQKEFVAELVVSQTKVMQCDSRGRIY